jgi:ATP-dependent Lhr-like helicase
LLSARLADYDPSWLDAACLSGRLAWGRVSAPGSGRAARSLGTTPIVIVERESWGLVTRASGGVPDAELSAPALAVLAHVRQCGACFLHDLRRLVPEREELARAISELVAAGRISSDSFGGMRGLLPAEKRRLGRARAGAGLESAGRWSLLPEPSSPEPGDGERWARLLLRRYGVVFRALSTRENAPPWRDLLREYRRLEARGEVRGGRFVERHAGEQFALPEAVPLLRRQRHAPLELEEVCLSACDPLNLIGTLLPGERVPALPTNFILFRDALPVAALEGGEVRLLVDADDAELARFRARLERGVDAEANALPAPPRGLARHSRAALA